jgi:pimeloyl-ACP methyl ester carboxylesterase
LIKLFIVCFIGSPAVVVHAQHERFNIDTWGSLAQSGGMRKRLRTLATLLLPLMNSGCAALFQPKTVSPMPFEVFGDINKAEHVVVLLPGIRDRGEDFTKQGFIDIARPLLAQHPQTALIAADAHWGYYRERIVHERLARDILDRYPGKRFSFVGISLGGFGALLMAAEQPERIERLVLLSPFLGADDYEYLNRLKTEGPVDKAGDEDLIAALNRVWRGLGDRQRSLPITLAYGRQDSFVPYYEQLKSLDPVNIEFVAIDGAHDWTAWRSLWTKLAPAAIGAY